MKKQLLEVHREQLRDNNAWITKLLAEKLEKDNIERFLYYETYLNKLTTEDVKSAAKQLLATSNMITALQLPELSTGY